MDARILGPLEVDGAVVTGRRAAILAVLLVRRGAPTDSERLVDEVFGDSAPPTAVKSVQVRIAELRRSLPAGTLVTTRTGYALTGADLDADRFEALLAQHRWRDALDLWRGPALDGIDTPLVRAEAARLDELRVAAVESWAAAALGDDTVVPALEALVRTHPLRERPRALLMRALYHAGRQADALAVYRDARTHLAELGIEPGPELRAVELAILRHDATLNDSNGATTPPNAPAPSGAGPPAPDGAAPSAAAPAPSGAAPPAPDGAAPSAGAASPAGASAPGAAVPSAPDGAARSAAAPAPSGAASRAPGGTAPSAAAPAPSGARSRAPNGAVRGPRGWLVGLVVVAAGASLAAGALAGRGASPAGRVVVPASSVAVIDPRTNELAAAVRVGAEPSAVTVGAGGVWVASAAEGTVARIDPRTRAVTRHLGTGRVPAALTASRDIVWVANAATGKTKGTVSRLATATGAAATTVLSDDLEWVDFGPPTPSALALTPAGLWVNDIRRRLTRLDQSGAIAGSATLAETASADGLAFGLGALWVASAADDSVLRLDPRTGATRARIAVAAAPGQRVAGPSAVAVGFGSVWVADALAGAVSRIDPRLNAVMATIRTGGRPTRIAAGEGAVWVLDARRGTLVRLDPRRNVLQARIRVGARATSLAAGAGSVWVAVGGAPRPSRVAPPPAKLQPVTAAPCRAAVGNGSHLIVSDFPRYFDPNLSGQIKRAEAAIRWVLERHHYRAGSRSVAYQACNNSTRALATSDTERCAANARAYAAAPSVVGVIGPYHSDCARQALPALNTAGPLTAIGPANTYVGLTRAGPGTTVDEPERAYPTGVRNFVRLAGPDDAQGAALALLARELGARSVYLIHDGQAYGDSLARYVRTVSGQLGVRVAGAQRWDPAASDYTALAAAVARSRAGAVVLLGCMCDNGRRLMSDLRARTSVPLLGSDGFAPVFGERLPVELYVTTAGVPAGAATRDLDRALPGPLDPTAVMAAAAAEVLLDAIARSDGTRPSINAAVRAADLTTVARRVRFDAGGDIVAPRFMVWRWDPDDPGHVSGVRGMALDRMITVTSRPS